MIGKIEDSTLSDDDDRYMLDVLALCDCNILSIDLTLTHSSLSASDKTVVDDS